LAVSHAVPAGSREVTVAFSFVSERTSDNAHQNRIRRDSGEEIVLAFLDTSFVNMIFETTMFG
jgi:hypothetical protein